MNDEIQKALIELEESLKKLDNAATLIKESETSSALVIEEASKTLQGVRTHIDDLKKKGDQMLNQFGSLWDEQRKNGDLFIKKYEELAEATDSLTEYIKKVDFPNRLDKIDNSVASINLGIQNLMSQIIGFKNDLAIKLDSIRKKEEEEAIKNKIRFVVLCICIGLTASLVIISIILRP